jgi:hypothetical protein
LAGSPPDGRSALTPAQREVLVARALETVRHRNGFLSRAQRQCELTAQIEAASAALLQRVDATVSPGVRGHLEAFADPARAFLDSPAALVGSHADRTGTTVERVLAERFGTMATIDGSARLVAHALVGQPRVVVLHDDVVRPSSVEAGVLVRALAPATAVVIVSDHPLVLEDAMRVGLTTCTELIDAQSLGLLLDRLVA